MRHRFAIPLIMLLLTAIFLFQFYRDPERQIPQQEGIIVSPADGKVIEIGTLKAGKIPFVEKNGERTPLAELSGYIECDMTIMVIFMSPFDVHINRSPISGRIKKLMYVPGTFFSAADAAYFKNERNISVIEGEESVIVIQVAGKLVRRISFYKKEGECVERGERLGMISFGSQVAIIFPDYYESTISLGEKVYGGSTILARKKPKTLYYPIFS